MFMASFFAILSGSFVSCSESDEVETQNTLKVTPSSAISFAADGNQDVVLTVETDAGAWAFEKSAWITATRDGNKLKVNAEANVAEAARPGRITITAGNCRRVFLPARPC